MTYADLKKEIQALGFSDEESMEEYKDIITTSVNRAMNLINTTVRPIVATKEIVLTDNKYTTVDMSTADGFVDFYGKPKISREDRILYLSDYFIEENKKITLRGSEGDIVRIYYKKSPTQITDETNDDFEIELEEVVQPLISLLAGYFIWLDDEPTKATMYQNLYDDLKTQILEACNSNKEVPVRFVGGIGWPNSVL